MNISVDLCFNILNLAVRIGLVVFLIKRYVIVCIQKLIFQENHVVLELQDQHVQLREACNKISKQIQQDEVSFTLLRSKFETWHQQIKQQELQNKNACYLRQKKIEALTVQKMKYLQQRNFITMQVPNILQNVMQTLQKRFAQDNALAKTYQTKLLDTLGKLN